MLAGNVPFTSDNPVTLVFKHVHEDVPSIAAACKGINEGVAAFLAHLTARAVEARPADASVALTELQRLQSTLAVSDWQYRLPPVDVSASDSAAPANNGAPTNVGNPVPPAPPAPRRSNSMIAHASWTGSRRTQQPSCRCSNRTSIQKRRHVSRCRQTASSIALTMPSTALHRNPPSRKATNPAILQTANPRKSVAHRSSSQAWWRCCLHVAPAVGHGGTIRAPAAIGPCPSRMV